MAKPIGSRRCRDSLERYRGLRNSSLPSEPAVTSNSGLCLRRRVMGGRWKASKARGVDTCNPQHMALARRMSRGVRRCRCSAEETGQRWCANALRRECVCRWVILVEE
jgi:hypothetical protein